MLKKFSNMIEKMQFWKATDPVSTDSIIKQEPVNPSLRKGYGATTNYESSTPNNTNKNTTNPRNTL